MIQVLASTTIDAPVDKVWQVVRAFGAIGDWLPGVVSCEIEDGTEPDRIGAVRRLDMGERGTMREQLVGLSDPDMTLSFTILETGMPIRNYRSTMRLLPITDGAGTYMAWSADFEASPEHAAEMRLGIPRDVYQPGLDRLKQHFSRIMPDLGRIKNSVSHLIG